MTHSGVKIHIFEILSNTEFTNIIQYPDYKSPTISDREKVMVQENKGTYMGVKSLRRSGMTRSRIQAERQVSDSSGDAFFSL